MKKHGQGNLSKVGCYVVLFLALAISLSFAASTSASYLSFLVPAVKIGAIVLMISAMIVGIAYMIAALFDLEKVHAWAKQETWELVFSFALLLCIIPTVVLANHVAAVLVQATDPAAYSMFCASSTPPFIYHVGKNTVDFGYGSLPCHMRVAKDYLESIFYEAASAYLVIGVMNSYLYYMAHLGITMHARGVGPRLLTGATNMALTFYTTKSNFYAFVTKYLVRILVVLRFQEVFLQFIANAVFPTFLAIGIAARSFHLTRKIGGLLIAIALCTYFVYPMFYVLGDYAYYAVAYGNNLVPVNQHPNPAKNPVIARFKIGDSNIKPNTDLLETKKNQLDSTLKVSKKANSVFDRISDIFSGSGGGSGSTVSQMNGAVASRIRDIGAIALLSPGAFYQNMEVLDALACLMFFSTFFSFFAVIGTIASIKVLSPMLGGDTEIAGLTRLI